MEEILIKITDIIQRYDGGEWQSVENLRIMLRELSSNCYFLTKHNVEAGMEHNKNQYNFKGSVAAGKIFADEQTPELRYTRKILYAANKVMDSMRSELSIIKNE